MKTAGFNAGKSYNVIITLPSNKIISHSFKYYRNALKALCRKIKELKPEYLQGLRYSLTDTSTGSGMLWFMFNGKVEAEYIARKSYTAKEVLNG